MSELREGHMTTQVRGTTYAELLQAAGYATMMIGKVSHSQRGAQRVRETIESERSGPDLDKRGKRPKVQPAGDGR